MSSSVRRRAGTAGAILAGIAALAAAHPTAAKQGGAFLVTLGRDTIAAETYAIADDGTQTGVSMVRSDRQTVTRYYTLKLDKAGNLASYEVAAYPPGAEPPTGRPLVHATMTPMGDAIHEVAHTDSAHTLHIIDPATTLPFMNLGFGMWQVVTMRLMKSGQDSIVVPMLFANDTSHYTTVAKKLGKDSVVITSIFGVGRAKVDAHGFIEGYAAPGSTQQVVVTRERTLDVKALGAMFAARPPIGVLSPRDTVRSMVGSASVRIDYGSPSMRGRAIFGTVVPWNVWWRTGANAATTMVTDKDLVIGGVTVPAGEYTLFTLPNPTGWKLIISKKTKEWGTEYDPAMDLARVDMTVSATDAPVEQVTYAFAPMGAGSMLTISWEKTAAAVMVQAK